MNNHSHLVHKVMLEIGARYPHVRIWKSHTGQAYTMESVETALTKLKKGEITIFHFVKELVRISYGFVGQTDLTGIMKPDGRGVFIEIKTGTGRLSNVQKSFRDMVIAHGGIYIECRDLKDLEKLSQTEFKL